MDGEDFLQLSKRDRRHRSRKVQLIFQDSYASMDPRMRVGSILREPLTIQRIGSRQEQGDQIAAMLDEVGLPRAAVDRYPHEFSGGQRQRLGLARALIVRPKLVIADEPVSALDVSIQAQILNLMLDLQRDLGLTYLFISHDLSVVRYVSDTIGVMYLGKMVELGPADDVYYRPVHPYTKGLIDAVPVADPVAARGREDKGMAGELPSAINPPSGCRFRTRCPRPRALRRARTSVASLQRARAPRSLPLPAARAGGRCPIGGSVLIPEYSSPGSTMISAGQPGSRLWRRMVLLAAGGLARSH